LGQPYFEFLLYNNLDPINKFNNFLGGDKLDQQCNQPCEDNIFCVHCGLPIDRDEPYFIYVEKDLNGQKVYCCDECS